jgi:hypothetical protein
MFDKTDLSITIRQRRTATLATAGILGSLLLVAPAAAQEPIGVPLQSAGGFCGTTIATVVNTILQLALYGGFAMTILGYLGANAIIGIPGVNENQEERMKQMQSSAVRRGLKIFAVPIVIVAINSITGGALPIADCLKLTPWV